MPQGWEPGLVYVSCYLAYYKLAKIQLLLLSEPILQAHTQLFHQPNNTLQMNEGQIHFPDRQRHSL